MRRALILLNASHEGPARLGRALERAGFVLEPRDLAAGATVPEALGPEDLLVVMGGPMGVGDAADPRYPWLAAELALLRRVLEHSQPVLGICLGAQLLAAAAGARVSANLDREGRHVLEVGWGPVELIGVQHEPALAGLKPVELMLHWHGDTFELPPAAVHLARSSGCENQAFRIGRSAYGLQFHAEVDADTISTWVREDAQFVTRALGGDGTRRITEETRRLLPRWHAVGDLLLRNIVGELSAGSEARDDQTP